MDHHCRIYGSSNKDQSPVKSSLFPEEWATNNRNNLGTKSSCTSEVQNWLWKFRIGKEKPGWGQNIFIHLLYYHMDCDLMGWIQRCPCMRRTALHLVLESTVRDKWNLNSKMNFLLVQPFFQESLKELFYAKRPMQLSKIFLNNFNDWSILLLRVFYVPVCHPDSFTRGHI